MAITKGFYERFRGEIIHLLTTENNLLEDDEITLRIISDSKDPRGVLDLARKTKEEGNLLFKEGKVDDALEKYGCAGLIITCYSFEDEFRDEFFEQAVNILSNAAICMSKKREFEQVGWICTIILDFNPENVKVRFRRAMAAMELGQRNLALWDLYEASSIDPLNKEINLKIVQLISQEGKKDQNEHKRSSVLIGMGKGVPPLKKRNKDAKLSKLDKKGTNEVGGGGIGDELGCPQEVSASTNDDNALRCSSIQNESMCMRDKSEEDIIKDYGSELSVVSSNQSCMDVCLVGEMSHENEIPLLSDVDSVRENVIEDSSVRKNTMQAESIYRFGNRRKADSYLSIRSKDYQRLRTGRPLQYYNSKSGAFITIQMVQKPINTNRDGEATDINMEDFLTIKEHQTLQDKVDEKLDEEESVITQEEQDMDQTKEIQNSVTEKENVEVPSTATPSEGQHDSLKILARNAQVSSAFPRWSRKINNDNRRKKKMATPQTLCGAGKRRALKRSAFTGLTNSFSCRGRSKKKKRRIALPFVEQHGKEKKKSKIDGCFSASSSVVGQAISYSNHVFSLDNESVTMSLESCSRSGLPTHHEMVSANSYGG